MKIVLTTILLICVNFLTFSQSKKSEELNVFSRKYQYLDRNYKIVISKKKYEEKIVLSQTDKNRIRNYKDSLGVVLFGEFSNYKDYTKAVFQLSYSWKRLSYHLWICESYLEKAASRKNIEHPYLFKKFILENGNDPLVKELVKNLKINLKKENINIKDNASLNDVLNIAMRNSKERLADTAKAEQVCTKKNCCKK